MNTETVIPKAFMLGTPSSVNVGSHMNLGMLKSYSVDIVDTLIDNYGY